METISDPLKEHPELIAYLMLAHMSSFTVNGHLSSLIAHLAVVEKGAAGPLNETQQEQLDLALYAAKHLQEHLNVFITATRLLFTPNRHYDGDHDLLNTLNEFTQNMEANHFQVESELPTDIPAFKADSHLVQYAIRSIGRLLGQIHPTSQGRIKVKFEYEGELARIAFVINQEEEIYPLNQNPDLFIVQAVANLHGGEFIVESDEENCHLTFTLSTTKYS